MKNAKRPSVADLMKEIEKLRAEVDSLRMHLRLHKMQGAPPAIRTGPFVSASDVSWEPTYRG